MTLERFELTVPEDWNLERIDRFIAAQSDLDFSRSFIQKLIKQNHIQVNELDIKANYKVKTDDQIVITIPEPKKLEMLPYDIPLDILYEDKNIAVINKPAGLVVHPGPGNWEKTLVNVLLARLNSLSSIGGTIRPGIVHRLDKDTAGLMIVAKDDKSHKLLVEQFANREVKKEYTAIVIGKPLQNEEKIVTNIARHPKYRQKMSVQDHGKEAITIFNVDKIWKLSNGLFTQLKVKILTGRTHQIRVHLSSRGLPIVGDPIYSKKPNKHHVDYLLLASTKLSFIHPITKEEMNFEIEPPQHFKSFISSIEKREL